MSRDDSPNGTNGTYVTDPEPSGSSFLSSGLHILNETLSKPSHNVLTPLADSNHTAFSEGKIYSSYNPETGINIASVLGGILVLLVIYVIYRTKCRKRILKAIQKCTMKYFPEEFPQGGQPTQCEQDKKPKEAEWISESAKMIWKERANLSRDSEGSKHCDEQVTCFVPGNREHRMHGTEKITGNLNGLSECDGDCVINMCIPRLPELEEDSEQATAQWVQSVQEMDVKERQLNGIILKIPPDLVSHNSKIRSHFNSMTEYRDIEDEELVNISQHRNVSLPCLIERRSRSKPTYANTHYNRTLTSYGYVPLASQEHVDLDSDYRPYESDDDITTEAKVPLDICPIVKIQHYHSRSKRRLTSLCRSSSDDISTSSSDEQHGCGGGNLPSSRDAKYMRLQTDDADHCMSNDKHVTMSNNRHPAPNCRGKHALIGNNTESVL